MQKYRFRVLDGRRFLKIIYWSFVPISIFLAMIFGQGVFSYAASNIDTNLLMVAFGETVPMAAPKNQLNLPLQKIILGFDINNPVTIMKSQMAIVASVRPPEKVKEEAEETDPTVLPQAPAVQLEPKKIEEIKMTTQDIKGLSSVGNIFVKNNTTYEIDPEKLLNEKLGFNFKQKGPQILIIHTHTSESYASSDKNYYLPTDPDRTQDVRFNVVRVGDAITDTLKGMGIDVIHDTTVHDYPSYNGSYKSSLATVQQYLEKYPSIKVVIDVHRDAMMTAEKTKLKLCTTIEGKKTAQIMLVSGTDQGGLSNPKWMENLKFAIKLQSRFSKMYPTLARPINLCKERYNMHTTTASLILEVGSNGNTLDEAVNGGTFAAKALGAFLKDIATKN